jgi:hypothetical protein
LRKYQQRTKKTEEEIKNVNEKLVALNQILKDREGDDDGVPG